MNVFSTSRCLPVFIVGTSVSDGVAGQDGEIRTLRYASILTEYPLRVAKVAPEHTPGNIARFFQQALNAHDRNDSDSCGSMCRKSLDTATKNLGAPREKWLKSQNRLYV